MGSLHTTGELETSKQKHLPFPSSIYSLYIENVRGNDDMQYLQ